MTKKLIFKRLSYLPMSHYTHILRQTPSSLKICFSFNFSGVQAPSVYCHKNLTMLSFGCWEPESGKQYRWFTLPCQESLFSKISSFNCWQNQKSLNRYWNTSTVYTIAINSSIDIFQRKNILTKGQFIYI